MTAGGRLRLILFVDPQMANSVALLAGHLQIAAKRDDVEVTAIVDTALDPPSRLEPARSLAVLGAHRVFNPTGGAGKTQRPLFSTCRALARRWRTPMLAPRRPGINDPAFVEKIRQLQPDAAISLMVAQIFRAPLLDACGVPLNYHPGLLPRYGGIAATGWSIYNGESESGFSFHRMVEQVDRGPILLQGAVPLGPRSVAAQTERAKSKAARAALGAWFDILVARELTGVEQTDGSTFTRADERSIRTVEHPDRLSLQELDLRLRSFEYIYLRLGGRDWTVTALRRVGGARRKSPLAFTTADGVSVEVSRVRYLPPLLYRALKPASGPPQGHSQG